MSEIRIAIPDLDLNNALRLDGNLRNYEIGPFDDVVLDFSRMTNFDPLPMLMAGAIMKRFRYQYHDNTFSISGINGKLCRDDGLLQIFIRIHKRWKKPR